MTADSLKSKGITDDQAKDVQSSQENRIGDYIVKESPKAYNIEKGEKGEVKFPIWKIIAGKKISQVNVKQLLEKGRTNLIKGFKSKTGKPFDAFLDLSGTEVKMEFKK